MIGCPLGMPVLARDHVPTACPDGQVQPRRLHPAGVVDEAHPGVLAGNRRHDLPGAIRRATVGDDHLISIGRVVLLEDRLKARLDVALLVEDRQDDAHEDGIGRGLPAPGTHADFAR